MEQEKFPQQPEKRTLLKTIAAAGAAGVAAASGGFAWGRKAGRSEEAAEQLQHSAQSYDCYGKHQAGITTPHQQFGIMAAFDVSAKTLKSWKTCSALLPTASCF